MSLMSFKGMGKSIRTMEASTSTANASPHLSNEFPAGYSLTRCSPAELVSASPAGVDDASGSVQIRGSLSTIKTENHNSTGSESTLKGQFFCPKNGEYLRPRRVQRLWFPLPWFPDRYRSYLGDKRSDRRSGCCAVLRMLLSGQSLNREGTRRSALAFLLQCNLENFDKRSRYRTIRGVFLVYSQLHQMPGEHTYAQRVLTIALKPYAVAVLPSDRAVRALASSVARYGFDRSSSECLAPWSAPNA
jgi:hypothetical protein